MLLLGSGLALAAPGMPVKAGDAAPNKPAYTLFDPTPDSALRDFNPDRPTKITGPFTVDAGRWQIETDFLSYTLQRGSGTSTETWQALDPVLKLGLTNSVDLELMVPGLLLDRISRESTGRTLSRDLGTGDPTLKAKVNLFGNDGGDVAFALVPYITVPSGDRHFGAGQMQGGLLAPLYLALPRDFKLTLQTEVDALANEKSPGTHAAFTNIASLSHTVPGVKDLTAFVEFYSAISTEAGGSDTYTFDTALAYLVEPNTQLDLGANIGLNRDAPDYQLYSGIAHRF